MFVAATFLAGCDKEEPDPIPPIPTTASRTVLVYMAADNNLGSGGYDTDDIAEMRAGVDAGGLGQNGRLLVYHSPYRRDPALVEIRPGGKVDTIERFSRGIPASTRQRLSYIIETTQKTAPAHSYGLVLWGHGTGWIEDGITDPARMAERDGTSFSYGPENGVKMNISTLADILSKGPRFDYIYFDCCYMSSIETAYELRTVTDIIVGSPTELITSGMPYDRNIEQLIDGSETALIGAARNTFDYYDSKTGMQRTCTMSVIRTDALGELAQATADIYNAATAAMPAGYTPQRLSDYDVSHCYYYDFRDYIEALSGNSALTEAFGTAFDNAVPYSAATPYLWTSVSLDNNNGLSTYILATPDHALHGNYMNLQWYADVASKLYQH